jgi:hypothetical protein
MIAENKTFVHAVVTEELKLWLKERARAEGRSLSNYVGLLLQQARQQQEQGQKQISPNK